MSSLKQTEIAGLEHKGSIQLHRMNVKLTSTLLISCCKDDVPKLTDC